MKRGDAFYKPMLEIIEFLQKNDFNVYFYTILAIYKCYEQKLIIKCKS